MSDGNGSGERLEQELKDDLELKEEDAEKIGGGRATPSPPAGPIPIPYPIVGAGG
jgi:hypothetical protein